jgi:hypothetical protein
MDFKFRELTLEDKKVFDAFAEYFPEPIGSEFCFPFLFIEDIFGTVRICNTDDIIIVKTKWYDKSIFLPPILKDAKKFGKAIQMIELDAQNEGVPLEIRMVSKSQADLFDPTKFQITDDPDYSEFIYNTDDLINLVGKKFHSKRNFITRFYKTYADYTFREYDAKKDSDGIVLLLEKWGVNTLHEKWAVEDKLIFRALDFHKELDLKIAVLYVGHTLVAFSINYVCGIPTNYDCEIPKNYVGNSEVAHTFFEKADTDYVGVYQVINQRTAELFFGGTKFVNRQCDMGVEGLRKAKLSYNPVKLLHKYKVQHRN